MAPVEQAVAEHRAAGYDFHDDGFTTLLGVELSSADWDDENICHRRGGRFPAPEPGEPHADAIRQAAQSGAYNVLLHPGLTNPLDFDGVSAEYLHAVETYNHNAAIAWPDQAEGRYALDALLARGHRLHVTVGDVASVGPLRRLSRGPR
jgi:hypothetical protein